MSQKVDKDISKPPNKQKVDKDISEPSKTNETKIICQGCIEGQANQLAHMDFGGCLYMEDN